MPNISKIARQGRACGLQLILATQRPDTTIIPPQVRSNMDTKICGRADKILAQIVMDNTEAAEQVPKDGQGRFYTNLIMEPFSKRTGSMWIQLSAKEVVDHEKRTYTPKLSRHAHPTGYTKKYLNIGRSKTYDLLKSGEIKSICVGQKYRIPKPFFRQFIEQN